MLHVVCYMLYMYLVEREMLAVPESKQSYVVSEQQVILHVCRGGGGGEGRGVCTCRFVMWIEVGSVRRDKALGHTHTHRLTHDAN